jgi:hypothetical protein
MSYGKQAGIVLASLLAASLAGCSGGSSDGSNSISSAVQNLTVDPTGQTTVVQFRSGSGLGGVTTASFEAQNGAQAVSVDIVGSTATIAWDMRVTPSTSVRAIGLSGVDDAYRAVTTSDATAPAWTIESATQDGSVGGDSLELAATGPRMVESLVEDPANWTLVVGGEELDLDGTNIDYDPETGGVSFQLGQQANLHQDFELSSANLVSVADVACATTSVDGVATGDSSAPSLSSATQNLDAGSGGSAYGFVVDFAFDEDMDPLFAAQVGNFECSSGAVATSATMVGGDTIRVVFAAPVVPGRETITLHNVVDAAGNECSATGPQPVTQPAPVVNDFDGDPLAETISGAGNDRIVVATTQALDPTTAVLSTSWSVQIDGAPYDLAAATLEYDLEARVLTIETDQDFQNGTTSVEIAGLAGLLDVDGQSFLESRSVSAAGETTAPTISSAVQNRVVDGTGSTLDVGFDEAIDEGGAEIPANWSASAGQVCTSAELLQNGTMVRLVFDSAVVPGVHTIGGGGVEDLAGNAMVAAVGIQPTSTDTTVPATMSVSATAIAGADNDQLTVVFDDAMWTGDVTDASKWSFESPTGVAHDLSGANFNWNENLRTATVVLSNGVNLTRGDDFSLAFGPQVRDLGGNAHAGSSTTGSVVAESTQPFLAGVARSSSSPTRLLVRFSEPCRDLDSFETGSGPVAGAARFRLVVAAGGFAWPTSATVVEDGLGVDLEFAQAIDPLDTLDVLYARDCAGNMMNPSFATPTTAQDSDEPAFDALAASITAVSGELNDVVTAVFDRALNPYGATERSNWTLAGPGGAVDLSNSRFEFDGDRTVTIRLRSATNYNAGSTTNLQAGELYTLAASNLYSAQGVQLTATANLAQAAGGDTTAPSLPVGGAMVDATDANAVIVVLDEACDPSSMATEANWDLDGQAPTSVELLGYRSLRLSFPGVVAVGQTLECDIADLAGNSGISTTAVAAADATPPSVVVGGLDGILGAGYGGDVIELSFNEPLDLATALVPGNYAFTNGGAVSLVGATFEYHSSTNLVRVRLADGVSLQDGVALGATFSGLRDLAGNMVVANSTASGSVTGDNTPPGIALAYVNWAADATGRVVDFVFTEDVQPGQVVGSTTWTTLNGLTTVGSTVVTQVDAANRRVYRATLSEAWSSTYSLNSNGSIGDYAGNAATGLSTTPTMP